MIDNGSLIDNNSLIDPNGYDDMLRKNTVLRTNNVTGFAFDSANDRDVIRKVHLGTGIVGSLQIQNLAVTSAKINDFSFNQGTGGTLTLGGTNNGNGLLNLKDATGSNVIIMNNTGLTINSGSLTIQNNGGTSVVDSGGVVSNSANFAFYYSDPGDTITTTSTSLVDMTSMSQTFTINRANSQVLYLMTAHLTDGTPVSVDLILDGTNQADMSGQSVASGVFFTISNHQFFQMGTGSHTAKLQWKTVSGTATADQRTLSVSVLGN